MEFKYLAQDEYDKIDEYYVSEKKTFKDPIEISINIKIERTRYNSVINRRKTPLAQYIKDIFKACK